MEFKIVKDNGDVKIFNDLESLNAYCNTQKKNERTQRSKSVGNGNGSLFYSKSKKKWMFSYFEPNGTRKTISQIKNENKTNFMNRVKEIQASIIVGSYITSSTITFKQLLNEHIETKWKDGKLKPASYVRIKRVATSMEKCCKDFYNLPVQKITKKMILDCKPKVREYASSSIDKIWSYINIVFKIACSRRLIPYNIMDDIDLQKPLSVKPTKKVYPLTDSEESALRTVLTSDKEDKLYCYAILLQLETGMRISELLALKTDDIDFKNKKIHVHATLTIDENEKVIYQSNTKTYDKSDCFDYGERNIPLTTYTTSLIKKIFAILNFNIEKFIFYKGGRVINRNNIDAWLRRIDSKYKIIDPNNHPNDSTLHSHMLRHTKNKNMKRDDISEDIRKAVLGHTPRK